MDIPIGSIIKLICTNGVVETGKLIEHNDKQLVLKLADDSHSIIQNPNQNIVVIRVSKEEIKSSVEPSIYVEEEPKPDKYYRDEGLRAKKLAELHKLRVQEERKRAKERLTSFKIDVPPEVTFGFPRFTKPVHKHPKKKAR